MTDYTGIVAIVYLKKEDKYLLIDNLRSGNVTFPAGRREDGETILETLAREVTEETGLLPSEYEFEDTGLVNEFTYNKNKEDRVGIRIKQPIYLLKTNRKDLQPTDIEEVRIKGWYSKEETIDLLTFDHLKEFLRKVAK